MAPFDWRRLFFQDKLFRSSGLLLAIIHFVLFFLLLSLSIPFRPNSLEGNWRRYIYIYTCIIEEGTV